jgi:hypothetical protein
MLDTGTGDTIVHPDFARRAGIDFVEACMPITGGNMGPHGSFISLVRVADLVLKGTHFRNFHAILREPKKAAYEFGLPIDGIIGANIAFAKPVTLDFRHQVFTFEPQNKQADTIELPLRKGEKTATLDADFDGVKVSLMFDSGAHLGEVLVLLNEKHHEAIRNVADDPKAQHYTAKSINVAGRVLATDARCVLLPFERSVIGALFFDQNIITVDIAAGKILITHQP